MRPQHILRAVCLLGAVMLIGCSTSTSAQSGAIAASVSESVDPTGWRGMGSVGPDGALYVTNCATARILRVTSSGHTTIFAGAGPGGLNNGFSGDGGPASKAHFGCPYTSEFDSEGNLYVADHLNARIRKIDTSGIVSTVAGGGTGLAGTASDGQPATSVMLNTPAGVTVDASDNVFFTDRDLGLVYEINGDGTITTIAGTGAVGYSGDGGPATAAQLDQPEGLALDASGNLYVADSGNDRIRKIDANGVITTFAGDGKNGGDLGDGGPATAAEVIDPDALVFDDRGDLYFNQADHGSRIRMIDPSGIVTTVAGSGPAGCDGLDGGDALKASLKMPVGVALDRHGDLLITDEGLKPSEGCGIEQLNADGRIKLLVASESLFMVQ